MNKFLGIDNVIDAQAILGADGCADGFKVTYIVNRNTPVGIKQVQQQKTVWVREYNPEAEANDGMIHGFGNPIVYVRKNPKKTTGKQVKKFVLTEEKKALLNKWLGVKKVGGK